MATRHLICVVSDGNFKIAQYGHYDGYPTHVGADVLKFIKDEGNLEKLKSRLGVIKPISQAAFDEIQDRYRNSNGYMNVLAQTRFASDYPALARDTGFEILSVVADSEDDVVEVCLNDAFGGQPDCDYAYVINFDNDTFEVYVGGLYLEDIIVAPIKNKSRFHVYRNPESAYAEVQPIGIYGFDDLPDDEEMEALENIPKDRLIERVVETSAIKVASSYVDEAMF